MKAQGARLQVFKSQEDKLSMLSLVHMQRKSLFEQVFCGWGEDGGTCVLEISSEQLF